MRLSAAHLHSRCSFFPISLVRSLLHCLPFSSLFLRSYYGYSVSRRLGGQLFSVLVLVLLLLLLLVFAFKLAQSQRFDTSATKARAGLTVRNKTTFTGGLRALGKSTKAQL